LQHYYTIYDYGQKKIGLIESKSSLVGDTSDIKTVTPESKLQKKEIKLTKDDEAPA